MILLDTNVVSELMRKSPDPAAEAWATGPSREDLFFSAVGEAELRYGAAILPAGRRRDTLFSDIDAMLRDAFGDRVLPFDSDAARHYGEIAAMRRSAGRRVAPADCQIAAIARSHGLAVATRNTRDFVGMELDLRSPSVPCLPASSRLLGRSPRIGGNYAFQMHNVLP